MHAPGPLPCSAKHFPPVQQCARYQRLCDFEVTRRSCRAVLARHRLKRRASGLRPCASRRQAAAAEERVPHQGTGDAEQAVAAGCAPAPGISTGHSAQLGSEPHRPPLLPAQPATHPALLQHGTEAVEHVASAEHCTDNSSVVLAPQPSDACSGSPKQGAWAAVAKPEPPALCPASSSVGPTNPALVCAASRWAQRVCRSLHACHADGERPCSGQLRAGCACQARLRSAAQAACPGALPALCRGGAAGVSGSMHLALRKRPRSRPMPASTAWRQASSPGPPQQQQPQGQRVWSAAAPSASMEPWLKEQSKAMWRAALSPGWEDSGSQWLQSAWSADVVLQAPVIFSPVASRCARLPARPPACILLLVHAPTSPACKCALASLAQHTACHVPLSLAMHLPRPAGMGRNCTGVAAR